MTAPIRRLDHPNGEIWTFDPERIADPNRKSAPWVWDLIASVQSIADAKRIADCWRYASGQPQTGGDDFFPGTAAQQLADYLFAAHLGGRSVSDVFRWCSNERDTSPADILSEYPRYAGIASRVSSVIALTPETRSGVFGSLQTMVAFLADPEIIDWIDRTGIRMGTSTSGVVCSIPTSSPRARTPCTCFPHRAGPRPR